MKERCPSRLDLVEAVFHCERRADHRKRKHRERMTFGFGAKRTRVKVTWRDLR